MDSILSNGTWELVDRPYGCKPTGWKWVFKKKLKPDGTIDKYKERLVAKGYTQKEGKYFFDTYSLVAILTTIHFYSHWLPRMVFSSIRWMLRQLSLMESWKRKSIWHNLMGL
jgi:hypothetical protein